MLSLHQIKKLNFPAFHSMLEQYFGQYYGTASWQKQSTPIHLSSPPMTSSVNNWLLILIHCSKIAHSPHD